MTENLINVFLGIVIFNSMFTGSYENQNIDITPKIESRVVIQEIPEPVIERIALGKFKITAYCPCNKCCGEWSNGLTYKETVATEGRTIAVDPDVISLGSIVEINGVEYVAEDIGGVIKNDRIDMFFSSHEDALEWGVQYHDIYLVESR